ncbi:MAG: cell envelope protein SmpA [Sedimenticola sp.]|jgi:outer membrane protein assembly factor BamE|nr:MAG: cell envelope protein SmpA [Sedimenticola sp.]
MDKIGSAIPDALDKMPFIYRPDIQQGNMVDQKMVDKLQLGMTKSQVRYVMGTPMLVDAFHQERWDYLYSMKQGSAEREQLRVALFFEDDRLTTIDGDLRPQPQSADTQPVEEPIASVPDYEPEKKGLVTRMMEKVGLDSEDSIDQ